MKTMKHYKFRFYKKPVRWSCDRDEYTVEDIEILDENDSKYCLKNDMYTTINKKKCDYFASLDKPSMGIHVNDGIFGNRVTYDLYTFSNKRPSTIKKEIQKSYREESGMVRV